MRLNEREALRTIDLGTLDAISGGRTIDTLTYTREGQCISTGRNDYGDPLVVHEPVSKCVGAGLRPGQSVPVNRPRPHRRWSPW